MPFRLPARLCLSSSVRSMIFAVSFFSWPPFSGSVMTCVSPALILSSFLSRIDLDGDVDQAKRDGAFPQRARHFQALLSNAVERPSTADETGPAARYPYVGSTLDRSHSASGLSRIVTTITPQSLHSTIGVSADIRQVPWRQSVRGHRSRLAGQISIASAWAAVVCSFGKVGSASSHQVTAIAGREQTDPRQCEKF